MGGLPIAKVDVGLAALVLDDSSDQAIRRGASFTLLYAILLAVYRHGLALMVPRSGHRRPAPVTRVMSTGPASLLLVLVLGRRHAARRSEHAAATLQVTAILPSDARLSRAQRSKT